MIGRLFAPVPCSWYETTRSTYFHPGKCDIDSSVRASSQEGGSVTFARVGHFDVRSEIIQQGYRAIVEHVIPAPEKQNGYSGGLLLADSQQGKELAVSLWASKVCTPQTTPPTGFVTSVLRPQ